MLRLQQDVSYAGKYSSGGLVRVSVFMHKLLREELETSRSGAVRLGAEDDRMR